MLSFICIIVSALFFAVVLYGSKIHSQLLLINRSLRAHNKVLEAEERKNEI